MCNFIFKQMLQNCKYFSRQLKCVTEFRLISTSQRQLQDAGDGDSKQSDAASKLNALLLSIVKEEKIAAPDNYNIQMPKPRLKHRLKKSETVHVKPKDLGSQIVDAAKNVASEIRGNDKEIEAQLLHKLLYKGSPVKDEILKLSSTNESLRNLLSKMNVEKEETKQPVDAKKNNEYSRAMQVRNLIGKRDYKDKAIPRREQRVNLFGEKTLGIFDENVCQNKGVVLKTWSLCEERERKLSITHPPSNYFEQMIDWTEKGVLWKFPINNEQGLEEENDVSFASHVLLETHLEGWCPSAGPIRHFMELVCVGLSRNYWLTATEKKEHISWYKEFFTQRRQLIKELGAGEISVNESL